MTKLKFALSNAIALGCQWRWLPREYPHWRTVYGYFHAWQEDGTWDRVHARLLKWTRRQAGRRARPSAGSIDSQCVKSTPVSGERGFDAFKKVKGRKRPIVVDTLGLLLAVVVTPASLSDTAGAVQLLPELRRCSQRLQVIWCDGGYFSAAFEQSRAQGLPLETVQRPEGTKAFSLLAKRWGVERTFAWLARCPRLDRQDWIWNTKYELKPAEPLFSSPCPKLCSIGSFPPNFSAGKTLQTVS